jgi:hypothetical protein
MALLDVTLTDPPTYRGEGYIDITPGGGVARYVYQRTLLSYPSNEPPGRLSID